MAETSPGHVPALTKGETLRAHVLALIDGELDPHDKLPTERELADQFSVSRLTVRGALERLEREGRVYRVQGSGTFVAEPRIAKSLELTSFSEDMRARGLTPGSRLVAAEVRPAGAQVGAALGSNPAAEVYHLRRVRTADGQPMALEDVYLPTALVPGLLELDLSGGMYDILDERYRLRVERADQTIQATVLDPDEAELLETGPFSPAFRVRRTGFDARGRHVEYGTSLYRGDRYSFDLSIHRSGGTS
jgi:GntR family transcriptional regulator